MTLGYRDGALWLLDQTRLPGESTLLECRKYSDVCEAIRTLSVRGAPAIGLAAAYGVVLAAGEAITAGLGGDELRAALASAIEELRSTRPTAVNLSWALERMRRVIDGNMSFGGPILLERLRQEADRMLREDESANRAMGAHGASLIPDGANVLTHCNAGALATGAFGTAVGVIRAAHESGRRVHVWVDETRPLLQGARLTAWELVQAEIPCTLITDNMAGHFMGRGRVDLVVVGADRVAANGDVANKIGTYSVATLAHAHNIPFYVAAPTSTIDLATASGAEIVIEERGPEEVADFGGTRVAPEGVDIANPAFDITPARLVTAIITERGIINPPFEGRLERFFL